MRGVLLLLGVLLVGGALALLSATAVDAPPPTQLGSAAADGDPAEAAAAGADLPPAAVAAAVTTTPPDEADEAERADAVAAAAAQPHAVLLVVRGQPPVPVADAEVFFLDEAQAEARARALRAPPARFSWPERFGQRTRTGPDGTAALPASRTPWLCAAAADGEFAFARVPPAPRTTTLALQRDETLRLDARYADGEAAAGVPLAVAVQVAGEAPAKVCWRGAADDQGRAVLEHFQLVRPPAPPPERAERFAALLDVPLPTPATAEFAGRPAPAEPVRLLVPALGSVELLLTDHRDQPLRSPAELQLRSWPPTPPGAPANPLAPPPLALDLRAAASKPVGAEPVRFAWVGVGTTVRVSAQFPTDRRGVASTPLAGPQRRGEVVRATLPLAPEQGLYAGRLLLPDGQPLAAAAAPTALWQGDRAWLEFAAHTTADGRFDVVLRPDRSGGDGWFDVRWTAPARPGEPAVELGARLRCRLPRPGERYELGDVQLGPLPPLCSGIVVDDLEQPVAGAEVVLQQRDPAAAAAPPGRQPPDPWRNVPQYRTRTAADGTFALGGERPPGDLRLRADTDRHLADSAPLRGIGEVLRIRIQRHGVLRGQVLLPEWVVDGAATLTLRPAEPERRERDQRTQGLSRRRGGRFAVEPLRPGRYDLLVLLRGLREPVLTLPDVFVPPGEARDGRLRPLDLRQSLFRFRLRAVDAQGQPIALDGPILARLPKPEGGYAEAGFRWQGGRAELVTGASLAELLLFGRGYEPTRATLGPGDHDVYLPRLQPAVLQLPGLRALCGPVRRVRISTVLVGESGFPQGLQGIDQRTGEPFAFQRWDLGNSSGAWLGDSDLVEVPLARAGRYEVLLRPHAGATERSPQGNLSLGQFDLRVDSPHLPVNVPIDAAKVAALLQQLDARAQRAPRGRPDRR